MNLQKIQEELKAPKTQVNTFGGYKYRNAEDILTSVKPLLAKYKAIILLSDEVVKMESKDPKENIKIIDKKGNTAIYQTGGDRFYIKATATYIEGENKVEVTAYARESDIKKGMDASQITGATSSYARKYALNGLLLIDDVKDADNESNEPFKGNEFKNESKKIENKEKCDFCGAEKVLNPHTGKMFCKEKCWLKNNK